MSDRVSEHDIQRLLNETAIGAVVSRYVQFDKGKKSWACCPFHSEKSPSFHVRHNVDGKIGGRFKCFGCGESGDVISFVMKMEGVSFVQAYERLSGDLKPTRRVQPIAPRKQASADPEKHAAALALWDAAGEITGTLAEIYLRSRGITGDLSAADIRFHANASLMAYTPHKGDKHPAMVAAIRKPDGSFIGAHVTYLAPDGMAKASVTPPRKVYGKQDGGAIYLAPVSERMVVGEGIESSLSAGEITGRAPIAAVCSGNMKKMTPIDGVDDWLVAYDRDANQTGLKAGQAFVRRATEAGKAARAFPPPADVKDWNDAAQRRA